LNDTPHRHIRGASVVDREFVDALTVTALFGCATIVSTDACPLDFSGGYGQTLDQEAGLYSE